MALGVYDNVSPGVYEKYSEGGSFTKPIATSHHGRDGDTFEIELFVRADDEHTYTNIQVKAQSISEDDDIGSGSSPGDTGWGVKLMVDPGHDPTESDWEATDYGTAIDITDISNSGTYRPFWYRIMSPRGIRCETKTNIVLSLLYTDTA